MFNISAPKRVKRLPRTQRNLSSAATLEARLARLERQMAKLKKDVWVLDKALEHIFTMATSSKPSEEWLAEFVRALDIRYQRRG